MGRGPDKHVVRKLIRKYFKFDINRQSFNSASALYPQLIDTWSKKGMNSKETQLVQEKSAGVFFSPIRIRLRICVITCLGSACRPVIVHDGST